MSRRLSWLQEEGQHRQDGPGLALKKKTKILWLKL